MPDGGRVIALLDDEDLDVRGDTFVRALSPAAWYRFGQGITVATGVSQWDDASGNGRHLTQGTAANQPAKQADGSILFDGSNDFLRSAVFAIAQPFTFYILLKQVSWTLNDIYVDFGSAAAQIYTPIATPQVTFYASGSAQLNVSPAVGQYGAICVVGNGGSSVMQLDAGAPVTGNAGAATVSQLSIGAAGTGSGPGNIQVKEAVLYSGAHDATTRARVLAYLGSL